MKLQVGSTILANWKLSEEKITYEDCKREVESLFKDASVVEDTSITEEYKQSWLDALEQYNPEKEIDESESISSHLFGEEYFNNDSDKNENKIIDL